MSHPSSPSGPSTTDSVLVTTVSAEATRRLAAGLAAVAEAGDVIALSGDLGAGKTQFAKGFAEGLGVGATVNSPSFVLMAEYAGRLPLFHLDLYRLADASEAIGGGLIDERQADGVTLIEWAERLGAGAPTRPARGADRRDRRRAADDRPDRAESAPAPLPRARGMTPAAGGPILVFDTATTLAVVGVGTADGGLAAEASWSAGYRHGEELLGRIDGVLGAAGVGLGDLGAIVVGTGPGAFTGLRVGLATAKGLAIGLGIPLVGISTGVALVDAAHRVDPSTPLVAGLLPAGPSDRILIDPEGRASRVAAGTEPELEPGWRLFALDLADRAPADALARGTAVRAELAASLLRLGVARLGSAPADELATLVPEYVTLPRGVRETTGAVAWSRDPS